MKTKKFFNLNENRKYFCSVCGKSYEEKQKKFTPSRSPIYKGNGGFMKICRDCVSDIYLKYLKKLNGNEYNAIKRVCMLLDIYFSDTLFEYSEKNYNYTNRMNAYLTKINLVPYIQRTFDDYLFSDDYENPEIKPISGDTIPEKLIKIWGFGFTPEEYQFLSNKFSEWKSKVVIDGMARESLVRDLCIIKL